MTDAVDHPDVSFVVLKHLQKHSVFMSKDVYAVLGIYTRFAEMFPQDRH